MKNVSYTIRIPSLRSIRMQLVLITHYCLVNQLLAMLRSVV